MPHPEVQILKCNFSNHALFNNKLEKTKQKKQQHYNNKDSGVGNKGYWQ